MVATSFFIKDDWEISRYIVCLVSEFKFETSKMYHGTSSWQLSILIDKDGFIMPFAYKEKIHNNLSSFVFTKINL